jgi:predicted DNA-binding WGR domain protein
MAEGLRQRGWQVDTGVGQSRFRWDLAARDPNKPTYALGIFIDQEERVRSAGLAERAIFQPRVLKSFGWSFAHVITKDWFHDPQGVLDRLERQMQGEPEEELVVAEAPVQKSELKASPIANELLTEENYTADSTATATVPLSPELTTEAVEETQPENIPPAVDVEAFDPNSTNDGQLYRYELRDSTSNKFWEVTREGLLVTTRHGRIGSAGQSQAKSWPNESITRREVGKLIREKMRKGYRRAF